MDETNNNGLTVETESTAAEEFDPIDPIMPEGWDGKSDFFSAIAAPDPFRDDGTETPDVPTTDKADEPESVPTTDATDNAESNPPEPETSTEPQETTEAKRRVLTLRVNHEEEDFDVDGTPDDELKTLLQKGKAYDRMVERFKAAQTEQSGAEKYRAFVQSKVRAFLEDGESPDHAKAMAGMLARMEGMKTYPVSMAEDGTITLSAEYANGVMVPDDFSEPAAPKTEPAPAPSRTEADFDTQIRNLRAAFPDLKEIPAEALQLARNSGISLTEAVLIHRDRARAAELAEARKENKILRQNAETASRAPVKGVSSGGGVKQKKTMSDYVLEGLRIG